MKKLLWWLIKMVDDNWGYSTPLQERYKVGDLCMISQFKLPNTPFDRRDIVQIVETGRHDYLVKNSKGEEGVVFQFELKDLSNVKVKFEDIKDSLKSGKIVIKKETK